MIIPSIKKQRDFRRKGWRIGYCVHRENKTKKNRMTRNKSTQSVRWLSTNLGFERQKSEYSNKLVITMLFVCMSSWVNDKKNDSFDTKPTEIQISKINILKETDNTFTFLQSKCLSLLKFENLLAELFPLAPFEFECSMFPKYFPLPTKHIE